MGLFGRRRERGYAEEGQPRVLTTPDVDARYGDLWVSPAGVKQWNGCDWLSILRAPTIWKQARRPFDVTLVPGDVFLYYDPDDDREFDPLWWNGVRWIALDSDNFVTADRIASGSMTEVREPGGRPEWVESEAEQAHRKGTPS